MDRKIKLLLLGTHDCKLAGHIQYELLNMPDYVEAHMVTLVSLYGKSEHSFHHCLNNRIAKKIHNFITLLYRILYGLLFLRCIPLLDRRRKEYSVFDFDYYPISAKRILRKIPKGFKPDYISIHWDDGFANARVVRELHNITGARVVFHFVDESHLTGGCHYPVDCRNYLTGCHNCPAFRWGKRLAEKQYFDRNQYLTGLPLIIHGSPYDLRLAEEVPMFKNSVKLPCIHNPHVNRTSRSDARRVLGIHQDYFVVFIGVRGLKNIRKGISFSVKALIDAAKIIPNLFVLIAGKSEIDIPGVKKMEVGYVDIDKMLLCISASNCFLSTTIADSGPMMVNYSIASGTPVVSFPIGIACDLVIHKRTGYLSKLKDVDDLVRGLLYFAHLSEADMDRVSDECVNTIKNKETSSWVERLRTYEF